jgi:hypothetical protein
VEQDPRAIAYASNICARHLDRITFQQCNALRFKAPEHYDLIWSAGLFDYLPDRMFCFLLRRLASMVRQGGEIVIGNFSDSNPSRPYMELFDWVLHHRSDADLRRLGNEVGFREEQILIQSEPLGVNLFMHVLS